MQLHLSRGALESSLNRVSPNPGNHKVFIARARCYPIHIYIYIYKGRRPKVPGLHSLHNLDTLQTQYSPAWVVDGDISLRIRQLLRVQEARSDIAEAAAYRTLGNRRSSFNSAAMQSQKPEKYPNLRALGYDVAV